MMKGAKSINLCRQRLWALPQKALYWQKKKMLVVADLHIGKTGHFRNHGIPVPETTGRSNLQILGKLIDALQPEQLLILGDLFHSTENREWSHFADWRKSFRDLEFNLVMGNHDILPDGLYHSSYINLFGKLRIGPFSFSHHPNRDLPGYLLSGHLHPAVKLKGKGRQRMKLPCFYFGSSRGVLPAFGQFTGTHVIKPDPDDCILAVVRDEVLKLETGG